MKFLQTVTGIFLSHGPLYYLQVLEAHYFFMDSLFFLIIIVIKVNRDIVSDQSLTLHRIS